MISYGSTVADMNIDETVTYHVLIQTVTTTDFEPATVHVRVFGDKGSTKRLKMARNKNSAMFNDYTTENFYTNGRPVGKISGMKLYFKNAKTSSEWKIKLLRLREMNCKSDEVDETKDWSVENVHLSSANLQKSSVGFGKTSGDAEEDCAIFNIEDGAMLQAGNLSVQSSEDISLSSLVSLSVASTLDGGFNEQATSVTSETAVEDSECGDDAEGEESAIMYTFGVLL